MLRGECEARERRPGRPWPGKPKGGFLLTTTPHVAYTLLLGRLGKMKPSNRKSELRNCPACQKSVAKSASRCPNCGRITPDEQLRRFLWAVAVLVIIHLSWTGGLLDFFGVPEETAEAIRGLNW